MLRAHIFELAAQDHVLFLNVHHIAFDEWSLRVLWRELAACYAAFRADAPPDLEELPIQYADFAAWQRENSSRWRDAEQYWRECLRAPLPRPELPADRSRPAESDRGARESLAIPHDLAAELKSVARRENVTLHALLLAAFQILLHRCAAQDDIVIGTPIAGRSHFQTEPLIGFFVNTLPLRASFAGAPALRDIVRRAQEATLEACERQDVPFERIVELTGAARQPGQNPLFDIVFSTQQHAAGALDFGGLRVEPIELETGTAKFDLTFVVQDRPGALVAVAEYRADLFNSQTIRQFLAHYEATLRAMAASLDKPVSSLASFAAAPMETRIAESAAPAASVGEPPPATRLQSRLREIWENVLGHDSIAPSDNFFEIGGHSLLAVKLIAQIEKHLGKRLPLPILFRAPTLEKMAGALAADAAPTLGSCVVEIQPRGSRPPIFWLHTLGGGGGGLFTYRKLAEALGPDQPSYGFVAPAQPFDSIEAMAARYISEMRALQPAGPYRLGGYCFGGVVAYEMARQLHAAGEHTAVLALLDSSPPDPRGRRSKPSLRLALHALATLPGWLASLDRAAVKSIFGRVAARLKRRRPTPKDPASRLEEFVDMVNYPADYKRFAQAHWRALMNYDPQPFPGRATLFKTDERRLFRLDAARDWRRLLGSGLQVRRVTGRHEEILDSPHVQPLASQLRELLS